MTRRPRATALVDSAYAKYLEKRYGAAMGDITTLKASVRSATLKAKAQELFDWMAVLNGAAIVETPGRRRSRRHRAGDAVADARRARRRFGAFTPGVAKDYFARTHGERDQHRG